MDVYSDQDKERLKVQVQGVNWKNFISNDCANTFTEDNDIEFTDEREDEYKKIMEMDMTGPSKKLNLKLQEEDNESEEDTDYGSSDEESIHMETKHDYIDECKKLKEENKKLKELLKSAMIMFEKALK